MLTFLVFVAKLLCRPPEKDASPSCEECAQPYNDRLYHKIFDCLNNDRFIKWNNYKSALRNINVYGLTFCEQLLNGDRRKLLNYMLGRFDDQTIDTFGYAHVDFVIESAHFLIAMNT